MVNVGRLKMAVEAISHSGDITLRIFPKFKGMVSTRKPGFEIAKHGFDPAELKQILWLATICDNYRMPASRIGHAIEARKAIGEDQTFGMQSIARPDFYGKTGESLNGGQSRKERISLRIDQDGRDKRQLFFGASSRFATGSFPAQIGVTTLYGTLQRGECFEFQHRLYEFVMDSLGYGVAQSKLATQR